MLEIINLSVQTLIYLLGIFAVGFLIFQKFLFSKSEEMQNKGSSVNENERKEVNQYPSSHEAILAQNRANYYGVNKVQSEKEIAEFAKQVFAKEQKLLSGGLLKLDAVTAIYIIKNWKRFNFSVNERGDVIFKDKDFEEKKTIVVENNVNIQNDKASDTKVANTNIEETIKYSDNRTGEEILNDGKKKIYYATGYIIADGQGLIVEAGKNDDEKEETDNQKQQNKEDPIITELRNEIKSLKEADEVFAKYVFPNQTNKEDEEENNIVEQSKSVKDTTPIKINEASEEKKGEDREVFSSSQEETANKEARELLEYIFCDEQLSPEQQNIFLTGTGKNIDIFLSADYLLTRMSKLIEDPKLFPNENEIDTKREKVLPIVEYINNITLMGLGYKLFADEKLQMLFQISNVECIKLRRHLHNKKSPVKDIFQSFINDERYMSNEEPILIG